MRLLYLFPWRLAQTLNKQLGIILCLSLTLRLSDYNIFLLGESEIFVKKKNPSKQPYPHITE